MEACLLIDFGSTFTKLTAVDLETEEILATAKSKTTVSTNIMEGFELAKGELLEKINQPHITFKHQLACSSAKGGFKMIAIGLSKTLTAEASKRVALGAGTRMLNVYSYGLKEADIEEVEELAPDIILVSGGTNGGNTTGIINDIKQLTRLKLHIPIVIAGNEDATPTIDNILKETSLPYFFSENVMPQINHINPLPTRELLRTIFMEKIIEAKGISIISNQVGKIVMPTPTAVLLAAELLSKGTDNISGFEEVIIADIGGATTDIHSIGSGKPKNSSITMEGLQEPFVKRTVEGDLGMRYSALSLLESTGYPLFKTYLPRLSSDDIFEKCFYRSEHPDFVSQTDKDIVFDETMSKLAITTAFNRHAGFYRREPTPNRTLLFQTGKDLSQFKAVIATGGVLVNSQNPKTILEACLKKEDDFYLMPTNPNFYLDKTYILSAMGLLSTLYPDIALNILKKYLVKL
ncbi:methylaspartate mutase accessory protein GlmL [Vagococcus fluvialis]|uniref:methylaspartate mutase accessory protein GlmL n=1 Tax=Vagococcus fluvialis TaxID=2738 RepID=UPI001A90A49C|nr:methylaspartate mutase accessory protein GlmL [Vagococcus fluvialis]MBO0437073.1 glutamate mutase L [Vagococcus fluvialis]